MIRNSIFLTRRPVLRVFPRYKSSGGRETTPPQQRVAEVAIVGLPNAGKSSLLNSLVAKRVATVSSKKNTTRRNLLAVASDSAAGLQVAFFDTPGFVAHSDPVRRSNVSGDEFGEGGGSRGGGGGYREEAREERGRRGRGGRVERSVLVDARNAVAHNDVSCALLVVDVAKALTPAYKGALEHFMNDLTTALARRALRKEREDLENEENEKEEGQEGQEAEVVVRKKREKKKEGMLTPSILATQVASTLCLVLNKIDLVKPKHRLLPIMAELHDLLTQAIVSSAASAIETQHVIDEKRRLAAVSAAVSAAAGGQQKEQKLRGGDSGGDVGDSGGGGGGAPMKRRRGRGSKKNAAPAASSLAVEVLLVSATAHEELDSLTSGIPELRAFLHQKAAVKPWQYDDENDEEEDYEDNEFGDEEDDDEGDEDGGDDNDDDNDDSNARYLSDKDKSGWTQDSDNNSGTRNRKSSAPRTLSSQRPPLSPRFDTVSSELNEKEWVEECVREQVFNFLHKELPYRIRQENRLWRIESRGGVGGSPTKAKVLVVHQHLIVGSRSHKKMAIGPKGETLRRMQRAAEADMVEHFGMPVELHLWVREGSKGMNLRP